MNTKYILNSFMFLFLILSINAQENTIEIKDYLNPGSPDYVCPNQSQGYFIEPLDKYGLIVWKVEGGHFNYTDSGIKEISSYSNTVNVFWDNVKSINGDTPIKTLSVEVFSKYPPNTKLGGDKYRQKIKSLNGINPDKLISDPASTTIPSGNYPVKVYLKTPLNFPGIKLPNDMPVRVQKYEWEIPKGWKPKSDDTPSSSGLYITNGPMIELTTDEGKDGYVRVRGVNDCFDSNDFSEYSDPISFTRSGFTLGKHPETVPLGVSKTYTFIVSEPQGEEFEWRAPTGWKINSGGNSLKAGNSVEITTSTCYTEEKVKVGLCDTYGDVLRWEDFPTTVACPAIIIPTEDIVQFKSANFSLDMPDDNIETVEWFVNDKLAVKAEGTSSRSFPIKGYGDDVVISALLTIKGCEVVPIPEIQVSVAKAPEAKIVGPNNVCNDDEITYTVENLPVGTPFLWSTSSDLIVISETDNSLTVKRTDLMYMNPTSYIIADIGEPLNEILENKINVWKSGINETNDLLDVSFNPEGGGRASLKDDLPYTGAREFKWSTSDNWTIILQDDYMTYFEGSNDLNEGNNFIAVEFLNPCGERTQIVHRFPSN